MCPSSLGFIFTVRGCFNDHWSAKRSPLQADDGVIGAAAGRLAPSRLRACGCSRCSGLPAVRRFRLAPAAAVKRCLGAAAGSLACAVEQRAAASQLLLLACGHGSWPAGLGCMGVAAGRLADATEQRVDMAAGQLTANPPPSSSVWVRRLDGRRPCGCGTNLKTAGLPRSRAACGCGGWRRAACGCGGWPAGRRRRAACGCCGGWPAGRHCLRSFGCDRRPSGRPAARPFGLPAACGVIIDKDIVPITPLLS